MNIVVIGSDTQAGECRLKFGEGHAWQIIDSVDKVKSLGASADVYFDFVSSAQGVDYPQGLSAAVFLETSRVRLSAIAEQRSLNRGLIFGFCGLPTLLNREVLEVSKLPESSMDLLAALCKQLGTAFEIVADQSGLVSARVLCMIINEAYYTLEEGTATRKDIDLAMKLGTNYPYGPFEWADRVGLGNVVGVLEGALEESGDERYRVCPLLLKRAGLS